MRARQNYRQHEDGRAHHNYACGGRASAADVLAVELLLHEAGAASDRSNCTRVVPLFETLDDLNNGPASLRRLFSSPGYLDRCGRKQEIMVGYSDSAKDAGRLAAWWAQYEGQEKMLAVCDEFGVDVFDSRPCAGSSARSRSTSRRASP